MNLASIGLLVTSVTALVLGLFVYFKARNRAANVTLALLSLAISLWSFGQLMGGLSTNTVAVLWWTRANIVGAIFIPVFFLHYALVLVDRPHRPLVVVYLLAFAFLTVDLTDYFVAGVAPAGDFRVYPIAGPAYLPFALFLFLCFAYGLGCLLLAARDSAGNKRNQLFWVFFSTLIGFLGGATTFFPLMGISFPVIAPVILPLYILSLIFLQGEFRNQKTIADLSADNLALYRSLLRADKLASLGTISAGLAHEIKNPLASIKGMTQVLDENLNDPQFIKDYQALVIRQIDRLNELTEKMLSAGKPQGLSIRQFDLNRVIKEALALLDTQAAKKHIIVESHLGVLPDLEGDAAQLNQVFINLILNAIQAVPEAGKISVTSKAQSSGIVVEVSDAGPGIPRENLDKIFDPFFSTREQGAGLGLAMVYRIIKEHRGDIQVSSEPGKGTVFKVWLPIKREPSV